MTTTLNAEKSLEALEGQLEALQNMAQGSPIDLNEEIEQIQAKIKHLHAHRETQLGAWDRVQLARHPNRPYMMDYVTRIFEKFEPLHGDRHFRDDPAMVGGIAQLQGRAVMVIGTQKGRDTKDRIRRNFGSAHPEGYRKALRLMQMAEKFNLPILSFIDTSGAFPGVAAEERQIGEALAVNIREMSRLRVPILATVIGEGGSGGALAIGLADRVMILRNAYYSVIAPEGCAVILWKDRAYAPQAAQALRLDAKGLEQLGIIDQIIEEPVGGAHRDPDQAAQYLKKALIGGLDELTALSLEDLLEARHQKFRNIGIFKEVEA